MLTKQFFNRDAQVVAKELLGKVIHVKHKQGWLKAKIIETEAYYLSDKGSHASLGFTKKRKALFMSAGTIYMYYARGGDSLNVSTRGEGNAVLIKSAYPYLEKDSQQMLNCMQALNPHKNKVAPRSVAQLCKGQTLLCKSLGLQVTRWDQAQFDPAHFFIAAVGYVPDKIIQTTRLGISVGRDEHLLYRFIDYAEAANCTSNPLKKRKWSQGKEYFIIPNAG